MQLSGRVAVVTGGASGIGRALARRAVAEGAAGVVVADLDGAGAERWPASSARRRSGSAATSRARRPCAAARRRGGRVRAGRRVLRERRRASAGDEDTPDDTWDRGARRQHPRAHRRGAPARARAGSSAGRLLRGHGVRRRAAHPDRRRAVCGDEARGGRLRRVAVRHLRRPRHPRLVRLPDGRGHADARGRDGHRGGRERPRRGRRALARRRRRRRRRGAREERFLSCRTPRCSSSSAARPPTTTAGWPACAGCAARSSSPEPRIVDPADTMYARISTCRCARSFGEVGRDDRGRTSPRVSGCR